MLYANHGITTGYENLTNKELQKLWTDTIGKPYRTRYLLSESVKIIKGQKYGYLTGVLYMTNALKIGGVNTCSHAIVADCIKWCLVKSGQMAGLTAIEARIDRLQLLVKNPALFFEILRREIRRLIARAKKHGLKSAVRLNGTTDLDWTRIQFSGKSIFEHFRKSPVRFYDYTKNPGLAENYRKSGISITFSFYKKASTEKLKELLRSGVNVAIAYRRGLPKNQSIGGESFRVIDGDLHDLRFKDRKGVIVGLRYKNASMDRSAREVNQTALESGFIILNGSVVE